MPDDLDLAFHALYLAWLRHGEGSRPMNEAYERYHRMRHKHVPSLCPHGLTKLTCAECGLREGGWKT